MRNVAELDASKYEQFRGLGLYRLSASKHPLGELRDRAAFRRSPHYGYPPFDSLANMPLRSSFGTGA